MRPRANFASHAMDGNSITAFTQFRAFASGAPIDDSTGVSSVSRAFSRRARQLYARDNRNSLTTYERTVEKKTVFSLAVCCCTRIAIAIFPCATVPRARSADRRSACKLIAAIYVPWLKVICSLSTGREEGKDKSAPWKVRRRRRRRARRSRSRK